VQVHSNFAGQRVTISGRGDANKSVLVIDLGPTVLPAPEFVTVEGDVGGGGLPPTARLVDIDFDSCSTIKDGGAITVSAGILWVEKSKFNLNMTDVQFPGAIQGNGGAIAVKSGAILQIGGDVEFTNNNANRGGAIWAEGNVAVLNSGNHFSQNTAKYGGAIASVGEGAVTVVGATFNRNQAFIQGGAIWITSVSPAPSTHIISQSSFAANSAKDVLGGGAGEGGAVYISAGTLAISLTDFANNFASLSGGGISASNAVVTIRGGSFNADSTTPVDKAGTSKGGAIYVGANGDVNCDRTDPSDTFDRGVVFQNVNVWVTPTGKFVDNGPWRLAYDVIEE